MKKNTLLISLIIIILLSVINIFWFYFYTYTSVRTNFEKEEFANKIFFSNENLNAFEKEILVVSSHFENRVIFLSKISSLDSFLNHNGSLKTVEKDFFSMMDTAPYYLQLIYLDEYGMEKVRLNNYHELLILSENELKNRSNRSFFMETSKLKSGQGYISPFNLMNIQTDLANIGTVKNPEYIPFIRYATPIFDNLNNFRGVLVSTLDSRPILDPIREMGKSRNVFIINHEGYYIVNNDTKKEYSFMIGGVNYNFFDDYNISLDSFENSLEAGRINTDDKVFLFRFIFLNIFQENVNLDKKELLKRNAPFVLTIEVIDK